MPDISQITLPSGTTYNIKDTIARQQAAGGIHLVGVTTTELVDEATTNPIQVNGSSYTAQNQDAVFYRKKEFVFDGTAWHEFGDMSGLGDMAEADTASGNFTPVGTVAAPTISVDSAGTTETIHNPTKETVATSVVAAAPTATAPDNAITYYSVTNENLTFYQIGYTTGDSITTTDVTVKTGDASYTASAPAFTGSVGSVTVTPDAQTP